MKRPVRVVILLLAVVAAALLVRQGRPINPAQELSRDQRMVQPGAEPPEAPSPSTVAGAVQEAQEEPPVDDASDADAQPEDPLPAAEQDRGGVFASGHPPGLVETATSLGVLVIGGWLAGLLFSMLGLPRITGYIAFGVLLSPSALGVVTTEQIPFLGLVNDLAIAIIALTAGGEIHLAFIRKRAAAILKLCLGHALFAFALVAGFITLFPGFVGLEDIDSRLAILAVAAVVGAIAVSGSPAVVVAVIAETNAKGPFAQLSLASVVLLDLVVIILFAVTMAVAGPILSDFLPDHAASSTGDASLPLYLLQHIGGSFVGGIVIGLFLAWYTHAIRAHMAIFVVLSALGVAIVSDALGLEPLIVALVAGMLMRNAWPDVSESLFETVEELSLPVFAAFFTLAAAKIDLGVVAQLWPAAIAMVALRAAGVFAGVSAAARLTSIEPDARRWIWTSFISQAGVTLALASILQRSFAGAAFAESLYNLILVMIALEEFIGPVVFRTGLRKGGALVEGAEHAEVEAAPAHGH